MNNENLTPELIEKAKGKTPEEIVALAQKEGIELTDEQLDAVSGGAAWDAAKCPICGTDNWSCYDENGNLLPPFTAYCPNCKQIVNI